MRTANWKAAPPVSLLSGAVAVNHGHRSFDRLPRMKWWGLYWLWVGLWPLQPMQCGRNVALRPLRLGHERPGSFWHVHLNTHSWGADSPIRSPITLKGHSGNLQLGTPVYSASWAWLPPPGQDARHRSEIISDIPAPAHLPADDHTVTSVHTKQNRRITQLSPARIPNPDIQAI